MSVLVAAGSPSPVVKWPGGKRRLADRIRAEFPDPPINFYWEPFAGGAAVFLSIPVDDQPLRGCVLADTNRRLMDTYAAIGTDCEDVIARLESLAAGHSENAYYRVRDAFNRGLAGTDLAAAFIYLNKTGFNGLYRENRSGEFNVPYGHRPFAYDAANLRSAAEKFKQAELRTGDFDLVDPGLNDVVYCDPPYHDTFTAYSGGGFSEDDQVRLRDACLKWAESGATVIISNSMTDFTVELYSDFRIHEIEAARTISRNGNGRQPVIEMLGVLRP